MLQYVGRGKEMTVSQKYSYDTFENASLKSYENKTVYKKYS